MPLSTTISKTVKCPVYEINVTLSGKYYFSDNPDNPYEVHFSHATCPIIENAKLPIYEQKDEYKYTKCTHQNKRCELLDDFPRIFNANRLL